MAAPTIKPIDIAKYESKQSHYASCPELPMRAMLCGPSGSGKSVVLQNMILDVFRGCFSRVYIFSPSIDIDQTWDPVKKYIKDEIKPDPTENIFFNTYDPEALREIISTQHQVVEYMKKEKYNFLYQILIVVDDFADDPAFTRNSSLLHQLYIRGRHQIISTITATQVYRAISPVVRKNITDLCIFRLRNQSDLDAVIDETSAIFNKATLMKFYKAATAKPYSFLYVKLTAKTTSDMFYESFSEPIIVTDASSVCVSK